MDNILKDKSLKMHLIDIICCHTSRKRAKYETCANLHRFHILYIACSFIPLTIV